MTALPIRTRINPDLTGTMEAQNPIQTALANLAAAIGPPQRDMFVVDLHIHLAESRRGPSNTPGLDMGRFPIKSMYSWPILSILVLEAFKAETYALLGSPNIPGWRATQFQILSIKIQPNAIFGGTEFSSHLPYFNFQGRAEERGLLDLYWIRYIQWFCSMSNFQLYGSPFEERRPTITVTVKRSPDIGQPLHSLFEFDQSQQDIFSSAPGVAEDTSSFEALSHNGRTTFVTPSATLSATSSSFGMTSSWISQEGRLSQNFQPYQQTPSTNFESIEDDADKAAEFQRQFDAARAFEDEDDAEFYPSFL